MQFTTVARDRLLELKASILNGKSVGKGDRFLEKVIFGAQPQLKALKQLRTEVAERAAHGQWPAIPHKPVPLKGKWSTDTNFPSSLGE